MGRFVSASGDFENVGAMLFCGQRLGTQAARRRRRSEIMERKNHADSLFSRAIKQRFECARRTQFNIDVLSVGQKSREQITAFLERQTSHSAFARIARGD